MSQSRLFVIVIALLFALAGCDTTGPEVQSERSEEAQPSICFRGDNCLPEEPDYPFDASRKVEFSDLKVYHLPSDSQVWGQVDVVAYTSATEVADDISVSVSVFASSSEENVNCSYGSFRPESKSASNTQYVEVRFTAQCLLSPSDDLSDGRLTFRARSDHYAEKDGESVSYTRSATAYDDY